MPPAFKALALELIALALVALAARGVDLPPGLWAALAGVLAALGALLWRMDRWWPWLLGVFPVAVAAALALAVPAWAWAAAAIALVLAYGGVHRTQVPLFLSRRTVWEAVLAELPPARAGQRLRFIDLGSGFGDLPRFIARRRPDVDAIGVELAPLPVAVAWLRQRFWPVANAELRRGDLWREPLAATDMVFAFLSPVPMPALWQRVRAALPAGATFISCEFAVPDVAPAAIRPAGERRLYVYRT